MPTLAEVKRGSNPEIRRTVVGQMLEYAAHAQTWRVDELRRAFEESCSARGLDPDDELAWLLQAEEAPDADRFWRQVVTHLTAGRLRLLFIADDIPEPLKRVVEFLNAHMQEIEVLAVEIKQFRGGSMQTLVPRVFGRTAAAPATASGRAGERRKLTRESFLEALPTETARDVAVRLLAVAERQGASLNWGTGSVSVRVYVEGKFKANWKTVVRLAVPGSTMWGRVASDIAFGEGESFDYDAAAQHIDLLEDRLAQAVSEMRSP